MICPYGINVGNYSRQPAIVDIDGDNDCDFFVGYHGYISSIHFFENTGTAAVPGFAGPNANPFSILVESTTRTQPAFSDLDADGDFDLLMVYHDLPYISYFENTGSPIAPSFEMPVNSPFGLDSIEFQYAYPTFAAVSYTHLRAHET